MTEKNQTTKKNQRGPLNIFLLVVFLFIVNAAQAQVVEVLCNNGKDDDGDGVVDCLDGDCQFVVTIEKGCRCYDGVDNDGDGKTDQADPECATYYGLTFVGDGASCAIVPPGSNTPFTGLGIPVTSQQNTADTQSKVAVGDVDGDGIPDAIITSKWNSEVRVIATTGPQADGTAAGKVKSDYNLSGKKNDFKDLGCDVDRLLFEHEVLIADIDKNGKAEIFTVVSNRAGNPESPPTCFFLLGFTYTASTLTPLPGYPVYLGTNRPGIFGIADMDGDGKAEVYLRDRIFAAENGKLLASEGGKTMANTALWDVDVPSAPIAVDIKSAGADGGKMELVTGAKIFTIPTITNRTPASPGTLTLWRDMNTLTFDSNGDGVSDQYFVKLMNDPAEYGVDTHSSASVADIDKDGFMDVVATGAVNSSVGRTAVFYWNVQKNTVSTLLTPNSTELGILPADATNFANYQNGWIWGAGRVNIGDANGDGKLDLSFIAGSQLYCVTTNAPGTALQTLWTQNQKNVTGSIPLGYRTINDSRSGVLTVTIYDFDNNGKPEMVYRDSQELVVVDGSTGTVKNWSAICQSHTYTEGPVIADVNGDGATDICVTCFTSNAFNIDAGIQQQALGQVQLFFSNGNKWIPTRKVWNQPGYQVVNINDNLTLPFPQLDPSLVFGTGACPNGIPGPQTPFNVFLNQVPFLSSDGCPVFPLPDLAFFGDDPDPACVTDPSLPGCDTDGDGAYTPTVEVTPPICGNLDIKVRFNIQNSGYLPITANVPVSFFSKNPQDPTVTAADRLFQSSLAITNLLVGATYTSPQLTFNGTGTVFTLYIVLNDNGSTLPITFGAVTNDCSITNNIYSVLITPDPFSAVIQKIKDNDKCVAADPNVGELTAHIFKGDTSVPANEVVDFSNYAFQWYYGAGTTNPVPAAAGGTNYTISALAEGDYTLVVTNTLKGCTTLPVTTTILLNTVLPAVSINVLSDQTNCSPPNGSLEALVVGGNTGFTFEWFSNAAPLGISTSTATNLAGSNYTVAVSRNGCTTTATEVVDDMAFEPDVTATSTPVVNCANPLSGTVSAVSSLGGAVQNPAEYTFNWYFHNIGDGTRGSLLPPANGSGPDRTALAVGFYEVEAIRNSTQCKSTPFIIEVEALTVVPTVQITQLGSQTSCDPTDPNGRLQATAFIGGVAQNPADFTFEWFVGQNTLPANTHSSVSGTNGSIAEVVKGGGQSYTVKVTSALQCSATDDEVVIEDINVPVLTLTSTPNGICDPALAGTAFSGTMAATVTFDGVAVTDFTNYTFAWYDGSVVTATPRAETTTSLSGLNTGFYTLVATRNDLNCTSLPATQLVDNSTVLPNLTPATTPSTNCAAGTPNGAATVTINNAGASTFSIQWFAGDDVTDPVVANGNGGNTTGISAVAGGLNYTARVTNNNTGCRSTTTTVIPDNKQLPVLTLTSTPNSICDASLGFNGTALQQSLTDVNSIVGDAYTFVWSTGSTMASPIAGQTASSITARNGGFYSATITNTRLGCTSSFVTTEILNQLVLPVISIAPTPSTNCVGGTANGSAAATVDVAGVPTTAGFTFNWFKGNLITDPAVPAADGGNTATAVRLQGASDFIVSVRNTTSGCVNTKIQTIADNSAVPVLSLQDFDNTVCDPVKGFNGRLEGSITSDVNSAGTDTYAFAWSSGNNMASVIAGQTSSILNNRDGGFFTATVTNTRLNCISNPVTREIKNNQLLPALASTPTPSTNCAGGTPNGEIAISVTNAGADSFLFQWFTGNAATAGNEVANTPNQGNTANVVQLQGGTNFTIRAYNNTTGCVATFTQALADISQAPVLSLQDFDNTVCDPAKGFNGQLLGSVTSDANALGTDTYAYAWSTGNTMASLIGGEVLPLLDNRNGGFYTATVRNVRLNCTSNPVTREIENNQLLPALAGVPTPSTNCVGGAANGQIAVSVTNNPLNETMIFSWFSDNAATVPLLAPNDGNTATATQLQGGVGVFFTVNVYNDVSGCETTLTQALSDASALPTLTLTVDNNEKCVSPFDGSVSINSVTDVNSPAADTYTIRWYNGAVVNLGSESETFAAVAEAGLTAATIHDQLDNGFYTVTITNDRLNCTSDPEVREVLDNLTLPVVDAVASPSTNCIGGTLNGSAIVNAPVLAGHDFNWYAGATASGATINSDVNDIDIAGIQGSATAFFTVEVIIEATGCKRTQTVLIQDDSELPLVDPLSSTNNINCVAPFSGTASVNAITYRGAAITFPNAAFTFDFNGVSADQLAALGAGSYAFTITHIADNCKSDVVSAPVLDVITLPVIAIAQTPQTSCDTTLPNGALTATVGGGTAGHSFEWFNGAGAGVVGSGFSTANALTALTSDDYTVRVINTTTRCESIDSRFLPESIVLPVLTLTENSPVDDCAVPNGEIEASATVTSTSDGDFTIFFLNEVGNNSTTNPATVKGSATVTSSDDADLIYDNLIPGFYTALIRDEITHCESQAVTREVRNLTELAVITVDAITKASFCGGTDGAMDISVTGTTGPYTFEWFVGGPTNTSPFNFFIVGGVPVNPPVFTNPVAFATTEDIANQASNLYSVVVKDIKNCGTVFSEAIPFQDAPVVNTAAVNSSQCDPGPHDGELSIEVTGLFNYSVAVYSGHDINTAVLIPALSTGQFNTDGIDNDGDGFIDGLDVNGDAMSDPIANDGLDNDTDGFIDLNDSDIDGAIPGVTLNNTGLSPGDYLIEITDHDVVGGCKIYKTETIKIDPMLPQVTLGTILPNTACDVALGDGSVEITVTKNTNDPTTPSYEITSITPAPLSGAYPLGLATGVLELLGGFAPQSYTIRVTDINSGCRVDQVVNIPDQPVVPQIIDVLTTPETFCLPLSNGNAFVNSVSPVAIADYQYTWYSNAALTAQLYQDNGAIGAVFDATKTGYAAGTAGLGYGNQTVFVRGERLPGTGAGVGCPTPAVSRVILDEHIAPIPTLTPLPTTSCDPAVGEGSISITTVTNSINGAVSGATYEYDISPDLNNAGPDAANLGATPFVFSQLTQNGGVSYTVIAKNEVSGCAASNAVSILANPYALAITDFTFENQLICNPDGSIDLTEVIIDRPVALGGPITFSTTADLNTSFDFRWHRANVATPGVFNPAVRLQDPIGPTNISDKLLTGSLTPTAGEYASIGAGTYYVIAERINAGVMPVVGFGCETPPLRVDIADQHVNPLVTLTPFSNTACIGAFEGELDVDVSDASAVAGPFTFNYVWTSVTSSTTPGPLTNPYAMIAGADATFTGLEEGTYTLEISNLQTGCEATGATTIFKNTTPIFVTDFDVLPQLYCDPSGSAEITEITFEDRNSNTIIAPLADFGFAWTRVGTGSVGGVLPLLDSTLYAGIGANMYSVVATRNANGPGLGCSSAPILIEIKDETENPLITLTPFSNTSCDLVAFEGLIEVDVTDASAAKNPVVAFTYDYTWTAVNPVTLTLPANDVNQTGVDNTYGQLKDGTYQISVRSDVSGCTATATTTIIKNSTPIFVTETFATPQFYCDPSGNAAVTEITFEDRTGAINNAPLVDFGFAWTRVGTGSIAGVTSAVLDSSNFVSIGSDMYSVIATRNANGPGLGCASAPILIQIREETESPIITLTPFSNTSCTAAFEGEIEIDITDSSVPKTAGDPDFGIAYSYDYTWANGTPVPTGALPTNDLAQTGLNNVYQNRSEGEYVLTAVNQITGCSSTARTQIIKNTTPVFVQEVTMIPQLFCPPIGSGNLNVVEVTFNDRNGVVQNGPLGDFEYIWSRTTVANVVATTDPTAPIDAFHIGTELDSAVLASIGADSYFVVARRKQGTPGAGCSSAPFKVDIVEDTENPAVTFTTISNTACDNNFDGQITVLSSNQQAPGAGSNYDLSWTSLPALNTVSNATNVGGSYSTLLTDVIGPGSFTVRVTNRITQCFSDATVTMVSTPQPVEIVSVTKQDQDICFADGSITVSTLSDGTPVDYSYNWFRQSPATTPLQDALNATIVNSTLDATNYTLMGAGTYYVVGIKNANSAQGSGCETPPYEVVIDDLSVDPDMSFTATPNSSCIGGTPNGEIVALAVERDGSTDAYGFAWTLNGGALNPSTSVTDATPQSTLTDAIDGTYLLQVTNTITGCTFTKDLTLVLDQNLSLPNIVAVSPFNPFDCYPTGSARVVEITIGGVTTIIDPVQLDAAFDYEWYKNTFPTNLLAGETNAALPNQLPDSYFVLVRDLLTNCKSSPVEVVISDANIVYPVVEITQSRPQISCDPAVGTAQLISTADGQSDANVNYEFDWFPSLDTTGIDFAATSTVSNLIAGNYSVRVLNLATNCRAFAPFIVPNAAPQFLPQLSISTTERTRCDATDGSLFASGVPFPIDPNQPLNNYPFPYNYTAELYAGDPPADINTPEFGFMSNDPNFPTFTSNFLQSTLAEGIYTVRLTDLNTGCVTIDAAQVQDGRVLPVVSIVEDNPLTNCDITRANGQLSATADGGFVGGYSFNWFAGATATGTSLSNINKLIAQTMGDYTVLVRNNVTGCEQNETGTITDGTVKPPVPTVSLVNGRTNCDFPNGWVTVNVNGAILGYDFNWYDDPANTSGASDQIGTDYFDLDVEDYGATATDLITGCVSPVATILVPDLRVIPQVNLLSTPSYCLTPTGSVTLELITQGILLTEIYWTDSLTNAAVGTGAALYELPSGFYRADFISSEGCENKKTVEVKTEILSYNLVSANTDNSNDFWNIDCIQNFPNNNVKIFNRSGVKVYEANGYDNASVSFRGIGEDGLYSLGNELPDGTYFYIIDKRDGSKPVVGYLELVH